MLTYFVRRLMGGVVTFLLASFMLYSTIVPFGASVLAMDAGCMHCPRQGRTYTLLGTYAIYKLDHPWPANFFTWLYDPDGHEAQTFSLRAEPLQSGTWLPKRTAQFTSLGLLRGDFGQSLRVQPGTPALAAYGIELLPWTVVIGTLLFGSMAVAYLQRSTRGESNKAQRAWLL